MTVKNTVLAGMFAAFLAVMSQISLPMPGGVPITIQVFAVTLCGVILGWKLGAVSALVYILLGAVGVPVFANFQGGLGILAGLAGGYIISWPFMAALCGIRTHFNDRRGNFAASIAFSLVGLALCEFIGGLQWALLAGTGFRWIFIYSMTVFVPKDTVLVILGVIAGRQMRKAAVSAQIL